MPDGLYADRGDRTRMAWNSNVSPLHLPSYRKQEMISESVERKVQSVPDSPDRSGHFGASCDDRSDDKWYYDVQRSFRFPFD